MKYIPKIKQAKAPKGTYVDPDTGKTYTGSAVQDYKGNIFKGTKITPNSKGLLSIPPVAEVENPGKRVVQSYRKPVEEDYKRGQYTRYFVQEIASTKVFEVTKGTYQSVIQDRGDRYKGSTIEWLLVGQQEDRVVTGNFIEKGIISKNQETINQVENILPGISQFLLKNPKEFLR